MILDKTILNLKQITKLYPGVVALDNVNLEILKGEVHAIVGENGAGKSTLIKTISGAIEPTQGTIEINGESYKCMTPTLSRRNGIAVIYQEFTLIPVLSAAENIFLGEFIRKGWICNQKDMEKRSVQLFEKLNIKIDPKTKVSDLTTGYQQIVEIAKAISKDARILIMDEPSAPLTTSEVEAMFGIVETLKKEGVTIIYISHRLEEIFRISDRVTVMRDGKYITTLQTNQTSKDELIKFMVGRKLSETYPIRNNPKEETVLSVRNLSGNGVKDISFDLRKGEILGLAGLIGAGRTELAQLLFGEGKITNGEIILKDRAFRPRNPIQAIKAGIALLPEDRKRHGVVLEMSVKDNITLPILKRISNLILTNKKAEIEVVNKYRDSLKIKTPHIDQKVKNLSGGNQQKIILAKWLAMNAQILILDEPTRGIDVGARQEIYKIQNDLVAQGKSIIMISSDMEELMGMADRMVVLCKGRMTGIIERNSFDQEHILKKAAGETK